MDIEKRILKIKAVLEDKGASDGEKKAAQFLLDKLQEKYAISLEDIVVDKEWFSIVCKNDYEKILFLRILESYKLKGHTKKKHSKRKILFMSGKKDYELLQAELNYHYSVLEKYLKSIAINYSHKFIKAYDIPDNYESNQKDEIAEDAAQAASAVFRGKSYTAKKLLQ